MEKIKFTEFFRKYEEDNVVLGIHCTTKVEAIIMCNFFDSIGKKTCIGDLYLHALQQIIGDEKFTIYNDGRFGSTEYATINNIKVYEFEEVDIDGEISNAITNVIDKLTEMKNDLDKRNKNN